MARKIIVIMLLCVLSCSAYAARKSVAAERSSSYSSTSSRVDSLNELYRKALAREGYGTYEDALFAYNSILTRCDRILNSRSVDKEDVQVFLPYYIAAAYRKGIVTNRYIEGSVIKLYRQLQLYEDADKWIQQVLTTVGNLSFDKNFSISTSQFGMLYYAKAFNRAGWAFAMLNGSSWKRYLIYPPSETMGMIDKCAKDLEKMLSFYGLSYEKKDRTDFAASVKNYISPLSEESSEYRTLALCYTFFERDLLIKHVSRQIELSVVKTLDYYYEPDTRDAMAKGKSVYSFEEFIRPESKEFIRVISTFLNKMAAK